MDIQGLDHAGCSLDIHELGVCVQYEGVLIRGFIDQSFVVRQLCEKYGIIGIPALIIIDSNGKTLNENGKRVVRQGGTLAALNQTEKKD